MNKTIKRNEEAKKVYDRRSLAIDFRHLKSILTKGMRVLDIGCGTGAISKDIAMLVGETGEVVGIDNTLEVIEHGKKLYEDVANLTLVHVDLFNFEEEKKFDLVVGARVIQWLSTPKEALQKIKTLLNPKGKISILDYNHNRLEWVPLPPLSMLNFYKGFLKWRADAGINNAIGTDLPNLMKEVGFNNIEVINSDETYSKKRIDFKERMKIWSDVAGLKQISEEGYVSDYNRLRAIDEYNFWVDHNALSMTMRLNEVRASL